MEMPVVRSVLRNEYPLASDRKLDKPKSPAAGVAHIDSLRYMIPRDW
jgi:hypothetical protein